MVAASYGSVYRAVMNGGTELYVADAIERREMAFAIDDTAVPGRQVRIDDGTRAAGARVIEETVRAIAAAYRVGGAGSTVEFERRRQVP